MRTTNKLFKELVQNHILARLSDDETTILHEQLENVERDFLNWYSPYEQKHIPNRQAAFMHWLTGLPSSLGIEFESWKINDTLESWFTECGMDYKERDSDKEAHLYYALVYREFNVLLKKSRKEVA